MSNGRLRRRFYVESMLAVATCALALMTIFWHDWIEAISGVDPDHHNGSLEWLIVAGLAAVSLMLTATASVEWRRRTRAA
jgi:hypothetical protein